MLTYDIHYSNNKDTNDFLRCLWARIREHTGRIGWQYMPYKNTDKNEVFFGLCSIEGIETEVSVSCNYSQKGCLSSITFSYGSKGDEEILESILTPCVEEARHFDNYLRAVTLRTTLDKTLDFIPVSGKFFSLSGNAIDIKINAFGSIDAETLASNLLDQILAYISFDTEICIGKAQGIPEVLHQKNDTIIPVVINGSEELKLYNNSGYKQRKLSTHCIQWIDDFLSRPYTYEKHLTHFDKSVKFYAMGRYCENIGQLGGNLDLNYGELGEMCYMSALEIISVNDIPITRCESCNQPIYSISKRVRELFKSALGDNLYNTRVINDYYQKRSAFVHEGEFLSSNNYLGVSIPLLSVKTLSGTISQQVLLGQLYEEVKYCILFHEKMHIDYYQTTYGRNTPKADFSGD